MLGELQLVEKKINGCNLAVPGNDEISTSVSWRVTRAARYPLDPPAVAHFLGLGNGLIAKVRVRGPDRARDAIDRVAATVGAPAGVVEHAIVGEELVDGRPPARGVVFTEDCVFYDPFGGVYRGRDAIDRVASEVKASHPDFRYQPIAEPEELGNGGRIQWVEGRPGEVPATAGTDFIIAQDGLPPFICSSTSSRERPVRIVPSRVGRA